MPCLIIIHLGLFLSQSKFYKQYNKFIQRHKSFKLHINKMPHVKIFGCVNFIVIQNCDIGIFANMPFKCQVLLSNDGIALSRY